MKITDPVVERFWSKVEKTDGCWLWRAGCFSNGYGQFQVDRHPVKAHRFSWALANRVAPGPKACVCHTCDNPLCVRPEHLWLGTQAENVADRDAKGRHWAPGGASSPNAKLTEARVIEIRWRLAVGEKGNALAREFGASKNAVSLIGMGKTWAGLKQPSIFAKAA